MNTATAQPNVAASKATAKRAQEVTTRDAQRKLLQKSRRTAKTAEATAKKLTEAAAKAVKESIGALAGLGGGMALFVVFSIVIVAGAIRTAIS